MQNCINFLHLDDTGLYCCMQIATVRKLLRLLNGHLIAYTFRYVNYECTKLSSYSVTCVLRGPVSHACFELLRKRHCAVWQASYSL